MDERFLVVALRAKPGKEEQLKRDLRAVVDPHGKSRAASAMNSLKIGATPPFSCLSSIELRSKRKTNTTRRGRTFSTSKLILIRHHVLVNLGYNLLWYMARSTANR